MENNRVRSEFLTYIQNLVKNEDLTRILYFKGYDFEWLVKNAAKLLNVEQENVLTRD